ncbi:cytochrome P450 [Daldinia loculata]|nr:cytochrome P450 [Daldinia loculata]
MAKEGQPLPDDILQWMLNRREDFNLAEDYISTVQLNLELASIHTTALTIVSIVYDLVTRPELIEDIREEIKNAVANSDGIITMRALFEMKLLDSVTKETVRLTPGSLG